MTTALFPLGRIVATSGALAALGNAGVDPIELLVRHQSGDWGDLDDRDRLENERGVGQGMRLLSAYALGENGADRRVWVITEADRSCTCILLPEEY